MTSPTPKRLAWAGLVAAGALILAACGNASGPKKLTPQAAKRKRLEWNLNGMVDAYQKAGHTNSSWDEQAKLALTEFARARSGCAEPGEDPDSMISNSCVSAVSAGCDDPLIRYLFIRHSMSYHASAKEVVAAACKVAQEMESSSYPGIRKFYAWHRASKQATDTYGYGTNLPPEVQQVAPWAMEEPNLVSALADPAIPPEEAYDACHEILEVWANSKDRYPAMYDEFEKLFPPAWKNEPMIQLLKGEAFIHMAWHARGGGYANTVTSDGWKLFSERLDVAQKALTRAWELNPHEPRIALKMMNLELGQGQGRDRMNLWFQRAMELDPNYYDACNMMLLYIEPKWFGSTSEMLTFGRDCVQNTNWGGHVPLILMDAHVAIQRQFAEDSQKSNYWNRPEVWEDLKSSFDRFFQLNPTETSWYHNYAWFAYKAGQWDTLNEVIPKLGPVNYGYFGGKDRFDAMVAEAKDHAGQSKSRHKSD